MAAYTNLGDALIAKKDPDKLDYAIACYKKGLKIGGRAVPVLVKLGLALHERSCGRARARRRSERRVDRSSIRRTLS